MASPCKYPTQLPSIHITNIKLHSLWRRISWIARALSITSFYPTTCLEECKSNYASILVQFVNPWYVNAEKEKEHITGMNYKNWLQLKIVFNLNLFNTSPTKQSTTQNSQPHANNSSANCQRIICVYLTILWDWHLKG